MRICMVAYTFYDTDNRVKRYAESLVRRGDQVDVIALRRDDQGDYSVDKGVNVYRIQKRVVNEKGKLTYLSRLLMFLLRSFLFLTRKHLEKKYDVIHVHNVPDFEIVAAIIPKLTGAKLILDIHDILPEFYMSKFDGVGDKTVFSLLKHVEKISCALADHVIVSIDIWRDSLIERSVHSSKCTTLLNYPDLYIFHSAPRHSDPRKFILIYPGTLSWHQGLDVAIRAFSIAKESVPGIEFHIYGVGPEKENLMKFAEELGIHDRVFFKGLVSIEDVADLMQNADLGVVPKRAYGFGDEAFSTKILEFMALGVPVVASDTRIDRYYFNDSIIRFFKSEDERELAEAIVAMARDESHRRRLAANALEFVKGNNWEVKQKVYFNVVDRLAGSGAGRP